MIHPDLLRTVMLILKTTIGRSGTHEPFLLRSVVTDTEALEHSIGGGIMERKPMHVVFFSLNATEMDMEEGPLCLSDRACFVCRSLSLLARLNSLNRR